MERYTVIAPGRVNLIGEHVDHQNYPVFPCAIEQCIRIDVTRRPSPSRVSTSTSASSPSSSPSASPSACPALKIEHERSAAEFPSVEFGKHEDIKMTAGQHVWYNYVIASYYGVCEYLHSGRSLAAGHTVKRFEGVPSAWIERVDNEITTSPLRFCYQLTVRAAGGLSSAAGLSSSSALTCGASMAWKTDLSPSEIATVSAHGEGYSGTASGGMDQAAIMLSQKGKCLKIDFHPLRTEAVALPPELAIVVANTGRAAPKAVGFAKMYNKRVFELKAACHLILKFFAKTLTPPELIDHGLRDVLRVVGVSEAEFLENYLDKIFKAEHYTRADLGAPTLPTEVLQALAQRCGPEVWQQNDDFHLKARVRHVLSENKRVHRFVEICKKCETTDHHNTPTDPKVLEELGKLLDGSFESLNGDFDCGCPELSELVALCRKSGAYGSRLTGAGWGGCTVSLVNKRDLASFLDKVKAGYFEPIVTGKRTIHPPLEMMAKDMNDIDQVIFATEPSDPARIVPYHDDASST